MLKKQISSWLLILLLVNIAIGCDVKESRPTYEPIANDLPSSGKLINWSNGTGFTNMDEIEDSLSDEHKQKFNSSVSWLATESDVNLSHLSGKNAKEVIDIANCLKQSTQSSSSNCIDSN